MYLIARTEGDTSTLTSVLQRRIGQVDSAIIVSKVSPLDAVVLDAASQPRLRTLVVAGLAGLALASVAAYFLLIGVQGRSLERRELDILEAVKEPDQ